MIVIPKGALGVVSVASLSGKAVIHKAESYKITLLTRAQHYEDSTSIAFVCHVAKSRFRLITVLRTQLF